MEDAVELQDLKTLNRIIEELNRSVDVQSALEAALAELVDLMGLETGWLFLRHPDDEDLHGGKGYRLAAHRGLPPALSLESETAWQRGCDCQALCDTGELEEAYNEVRCSRLAAVEGERRGLRVHASTPLRSRSRTLGILNVAGKSWDSFTPRALELLTNVGSQIGTALERAHFYDALQQKRDQEQAALLTLSSRLLRRPDLEGMMESLIDESRAVTGAAAGALLLSTERSAIYRFRQALGWQGRPVEGGATIDADDASFLCRALREGEPVFVADLRELQPSAIPPVFDGEGFVGAACLPLTTERGTLGGLILTHHKPLELEEGSKRFLQLAAQQAAAAFEQARLHEEELARRQLEEELGVAREIQRSLLPREIPSLEGWDLAAGYEAARQVGGDFFDLFWPPEPPGSLGIVIADVMGKGVPAALFMAMSRTLIRSTALSGRSPAQALLRAHELILKDTSADHFLSAFYAALDPQSGLLIFSNAGHNPPLLLRAAGGDFLELGSQGMILGAVENIALGERTLRMESGDLAVFYTDGVTEALSQDGEPFGAERLRQTLSESETARASGVLEAVLAAVAGHRAGAPQSDDLTIVVVKRLAG